MKKAAKNVFGIGFIIGLGLLGSLHGIVRGQDIHYITDSANLKVQTISDKLFTSLIASLCFWGGIKVYNDARNHVFHIYWKIFLGSILMGGGTFNVIEGIVYHLILKVHHVMPGNSHELFYDLLFILVGALLLIVGMVLAGILNDIRRFEKPKPRA